MCFKRGPKVDILDALGFLTVKIVILVADQTFFLSTWNIFFDGVEAHFFVDIC